MSTMDEKLPLKSLDPGSNDPGFWLRFHSRVMAQAQGELARRRMAGELSVVDVVFAWRRALVPLALMAAALAGFLLVGNDSGSPTQMVALEDLLTEDLNLLDGSGVLSPEGKARSAVFAMTEGEF